MKNKVKYVKPVVKERKQLIVAGGCGDLSEAACKAMAYMRSGPGCGDLSEAACKTQAYRR